MKKSILFAALLLVLAGCNNTYDPYNPVETEANNQSHFRRWRQYNDAWYADYRDNKLGSDTGVVRTEVLPSGILIEVYHDGFGAIPKRTKDPVRGSASDILVSMDGYLVDGTNFLLRGRLQYTLSDMIEGLQQVFSIMHQGSHWRVYLPYDVGYGDKGSVGTSHTGNFAVPPYSVLIFDIDLLEVDNY